jgi:hypothetical protein
MCQKFNLNDFYKKNYYNKKEKVLLSNLKPSYFKYIKKKFFHFISDKKNNNKIFF